ncbi:helix-turn-helix transcriptional regulator [Fructilactobacillus sp. Tb1]|uniref:helix-turn-helix transcriptional regulator n=1 Tax=Fructilactobacillus sp. Tb1 TaxID=3422304 RepID=UPI003D2B61C8
MIIFPSKTMARKLGMIVKGRREDLHMSQVELAKGLCTQATISTLENKGCFKSWEIVPQIFEKLRLDLNDLENDCHYRYGEKKLIQIEKNLLTHNFTKAQNRLNKIKKENLDTTNLIARFKCSSGYIDLFVNNNQDAAISKFQSIIDKHQTRDNQLTIGWSYLGLALAYYQIELQQQTRYYLNFAIKSLHLCLNKKSEARDFYSAIRFGLSLVIMINKSADFDQALTEINLLITRLKQYRSFYCLHDLYELKGDCFANLNQKEKAAKYYDQANQIQGLYSYSNFQKLSQLIN